MKNLITTLTLLIAAPAMAVTTEFSCIPQNLLKAGDRVILNTKKNVRKKISEGVYVRMIVTGNGTIEETNVGRMYFQSDTGHHAIDLSDLNPCDLGSNEVKVIETICSDYIDLDAEAISVTKISLENKCHVNDLVETSAPHTVSENWERTNEGLTKKIVKIPVYTIGKIVAAKSEHAGLTILYVDFKGDGCSSVKIPIALGATIVKLLTL